MVSPKADTILHDADLICGILADCVHNSVKPPDEVRREAGGLLIAARRHFSEAALIGALRSSGMPFEEALDAVADGTFDPFETVEIPFRDDAHPPPDGDATGHYSVISLDDLKKAMQPLVDTVFSQVDWETPEQVGVALSACVAMSDDPEALTGDAIEVSRYAAKLGYVSRIIEFEVAQEEDYDASLAEALQRSRERQTFGEDWFAAVSATAMAFSRATCDTSTDDPVDVSMIGAEGCGQQWREVFAGEILSVLLHPDIAKQVLGRSVDLDPETGLAALEGISQEDVLVHWWFGYWMRACEMSTPDGVLE
jgi:hypothetical protein